MGSEMCIRDRRKEIDFDAWKRKVDNGLERESNKEKEEEKEAGDGQGRRRNKEPICSRIPLKRK